MIGLELQFKDKIISVPLLDSRVISITVTQKGDNIEIIFGCMDFVHPERPISRIWLNSQLETGDNLAIFVKYFDGVYASPQVNEHVFVPYAETDEEKIKIYNSLKKRLENAGML
jgi:hypothetical protein